VTDVHVCMQTIGRLYMEKPVVPTQLLQHTQLKTGVWPKICYLEKNETKHSNMRFIYI